MRRLAIRRWATEQHGRLGQWPGSRSLGQGLQRGRDRTRKIVVTRTSGLDDSPSDVRYRETWEVIEARSKERRRKRADEVKRMSEVVLSWTTKIAGFCEVFEDGGLGKACLVEGEKE